MAQAETAPSDHEAAPLVISGLALANPYVGQGVYSLRLIEALLNRKAPFLVLATSDIGRPVEIPAENFRQLPPLQAPQIKQIRGIVSGTRVLRHSAREFPDAIFHSPAPILGLTKPTRTIITLHDCIYRSFSNYNGRFYLRRLLLNAMERFAAGASLILTDSEFSRRQLITLARIRPELIEVLYPWVGNNFLRPIDPDRVSALRSKLNLPAKFWLYLGGYDYRKNVELLIETYGAALRHRDLPPLILAGNIPIRRHEATCDVFGALRKASLPTDHVIMPGVISNADLPILYKAASLLIYPSLMEGFGLPPAEAMAVGTPVLVSNNSSLPEVVPQENCLFDARNSKGLTEKILAAAINEAQFTCPLSKTFMEDFAINRYLQLFKLPLPETR